jgi:LuxR family maltose regulon positive regulatory protein
VSDLVAIRDHARFSGPTMRSGVVDRARLDDRYASATGRVLRVLAPAGYGKSTQVLRWVVADERKVRWLDLERIDNDPLVLAHVVANGLADQQRDNVDRAADDGAPFADVAQLIACPDEPFVLVLDDIHRIVSKESAGLIELIIDRLSPDSTLVLIGRSQPHAESIARHRLEPGVVDVTADDLAFDLAETEEMLTSLGLQPDIDMITSIAEQFEGWPAGLRLAGQVLATRRAGTDVSLSKLGDLAYVTDYLTQEWFATLDADDQTFLAEVGGLRRFTGPQCDAILGRRDSASMLRRLCRDELMLIGLDRHDEWYRMHAVLSRWLSGRLRSADPDRWREIQVAAATWWSAEGDIDLAIEHAAAAGDLDLLETFVLQHCGAYAARGMFRTIERWMEHFTEQRVRDSMPLKQVKAILNVGFGNGGQALNWTRLCRTEHVAVDGAPACVDDVLALQTDALFATLENLPARELIPIARNAYAQLPPGEWRALACLALGANGYLCGHDDAIDLLRESLFENEVANSTTLQATAAATLAIVLDIEGSADEAAELSKRAIRLLSTPLGRDASATALSLAIASIVDARSGRHEDATGRRDAARRKLANFDRSAPWFGILGLIPLVRTSLLLDDARTALELVHQLERKVEIQDRTTPLARHIDELRTTVQAANDVYSDRSWGLTRAELRVVQYLPTNLSLADIATRLFVSRNTVKSQVAAIYRKLGTTSRTEAVDRARTAGLITEIRADA